MAYDYDLIVLTAYGTDDAGELTALGASAFFKKPTALPVIARAVFELTGTLPPASWRS